MTGKLIEYPPSALSHGGKKKKIFHNLHVRYRFRHCGDTIHHQQAPTADVRGHGKRMGEVPVAHWHRVVDRPGNDGRASRPEDSQHRRGSSIGGHVPNPRSNRAADDRGVIGSIVRRI